MSKFELITRSVISAVFLMFGLAFNAFMDRWVATQMTPALMFADGPEQTFGPDMLARAGDIGLIVGLAVAVLLLFPVVKFEYASSKETPREASH